MTPKKFFARSYNVLYYNTKHDIMTLVKLRGKYSLAGGQAHEQLGERCWAGADVDPDGRDDAKRAAGRGKEEAEGRVMAKWLLTEDGGEMISLARVQTIAISDMSNPDVSGEILADLFIIEVSVAEFDDYITVCENLTRAEANQALRDIANWPDDVAIITMIDIGDDVRRNR